MERGNLSFRSMQSENVRAEDLVIEDGNRGSPIPFINIGNTSSGRPRVAAVTDEAKKLLSSIEGPICVVSSVGLFKSGKSSLLNRVLIPSGEDGFCAEAADGQPCTRGLWIWSEPIAAQAPDGTEVSMIVVDCEGLDGSSGASERDSSIFSLSVLLSSFMIYNSVGPLSDEAVETLWGFVHAMTNSVQLSSSSGSDDDDRNEPPSFADLMPKLLWAFRDEKMQRRDENGRQFSSRQHMERALEEAATHFDSDKVRQLNKAKAGLRRLFADRDCFPAAAVMDANASGQASPGQSLESSVLSGPRRAAVLRDSLRKQAAVKAVFGAELSGRMLAELAEQLVTAINRGQPFNLADAWTEVSDQECSEGMAGAVQGFTDALGALRPQLPTGASELAQWHAEASAGAMEDFTARSLPFQAGRVRKYKQHLEATLKAAWDKVSADNWKAGAYRGRELLRELYRPVEEKLHGNEYGSFADYERDRLKAPRHQSVLSVLHEAMEDAVASAASRFITKATVQAQDTEFRLEEEVESLRFDLKQEKAASEGALAALQDKARQQEEWIGALRGKEREAREALAAEKERHSQQLLDIGQAHSKALAEALQERDEALRARDEAQLTLAHSSDKLKELSEWKEMNTSRAVWEAEEQRAGERDGDAERTLESALSRTRRIQRHLDALAAILPIPSSPSSAPAPAPAPALPGSASLALDSTSAAGGRRVHALTSALEAEQAALLGRLEGMQGALRRQGHLIPAVIATPEISPVLRVGASPPEQPLRGGEGAARGPGAGGGSGVLEGGELGSAGAVDESVEWFTPVKDDGLARARASGGAGYGKGGDGWKVEGEGEARVGAAGRSRAAAADPISEISEVREEGGEAGSPPRPPQVSRLDLSNLTEKSRTPQGSTAGGGAGAGRGVESKLADSTGKGARAGAGSLGGSKGRIAGSPESEASCRECGSASAKQDRLVSRIEQLENTVRKPTFVKVEEARTESMNGKQYTVYRVAVLVSGQAQYSLDKRYSEFLELHRKLKQQFPFERFPDLADDLFGGLKSLMWLNRFDPEFIECRRVWLESYIVGVLEVARLARSRLLHAFLALNNAALHLTIPPGPKSLVQSVPLGSDDGSLDSADAAPVSAPAPVAHVSRFRASKSPEAAGVGAAAAGGSGGGAAGASPQVKGRPGVSPAVGSGKGAWAKGIEAKGSQSEVGEEAREGEGEAFLRRRSSGAKVAASADRSAVAALRESRAKP